MQNITEQQLNYWIVDLGKKLSKQFNLDSSSINQVLQKSAKELGIYNLNTVIKTQVNEEKKAVVSREQVETWFKAPGKGGLKISDLKQKASEFGLDHKLKKEELKDAFMKLTTVSSETTMTTTSVQQQQPNRGVTMIVSRHPHAKAWCVKGTDYVIKSPKERWIVGKVHSDRIVELTFQDRALCHTNGWRLEKGVPEPVEIQSTEETIDLTGAEEYQVLDVEEDLVEEEDSEPDEDDGGAASDDD